MHYDLSKYVSRSLWSVKHPNTLHDWLHSAFLLHRPVYVSELGKNLQKYKVGSTKEEQAILWYIDRNGEVIDGIVKNYYPNDTPPSTHEPISQRIGMQERELCFYGEHLLRDYPKEVVYIVADEVTAVFMACVVPDGVWLSCDEERLPTKADEVLAGRRVVVCNGGNGDVWKRFLRDSRVVIRPEIIGIASEEFAPFYDMYLRQRRQELESKTNSLERIIFQSEAAR